MLLVTSQALRFAEQVLRRKVLRAPGARTDACMRLARSFERLELVLDDPRPGDERFGLGGRTVLIVDRALADALDGLRLAVDETRVGTRHLCVERTTP